VVFLIASFFGRKGLIEIYRARKNYAALLEEIERLKAERSRLENEIKELMTNPKAVELEAREKLWLMKKDEKVIVKKPKK
jgi:cell division protein FtsB